MYKSILAILIPLSTPSASATQQLEPVPITGSVTQDCAVAVEVKPFLYSLATQRREDALRSELRVRDSKGRDVPYALRAQKARVVEATKEWRKLRIVRVAESDVRLVVDVEYPLEQDGLRPDRFIALKVDTPLTDFEQSVEVSSDGVPLASGVLCDYRKFADVRVTEMAFESSFRRTLTVAFSKPTSEAADAAFERTIRENGEGKLEAKTVRESVVNRPFRIDAIYAAYPGSRVSFKPARPLDVSCAATSETDARAKKTVVEVSAYGMPVTAVGVNATDRNFSRAASVFRRMDGRWHHLASGRISAVNLPGEKRRSLEIGFGREVRESELRIEIENDDNPPLSLDNLPVSFKVTRYDVVFIAKPEESYSLVVVNGAERPRYDETILGYIDRVQDPVRLEVNLPTIEEFQSAKGPTAVWLSIPSRVIIQIVSVIVFVVLGIVCFRLFKSTNPPSQGAT